MFQDNKSFNETGWKCFGDTLNCYRKFVRMISENLKKPHCTNRQCLIPGNDGVYSHNKEYLMKDREIMTWDVCPGSPLSSMMQ